jgi:ABC-type transport system involved in multi-copper enzyme maturation permease subunit
MRVLAIIRNTFRENVRDKILYNLILFALIMIAISIALGNLTLGHENKVIIDLGLSCISIFGTLIAIFVGVSLVSKELEKRTIYAILAKPVRRWEFILGKYLGLLLTLFVNLAIMSAGLMVALLYQGGTSLMGYVWLLPAIYLISLSMAVTTAVAMTFSTFSTPTLSTLFTFFFWVIGHFNADLLEFGQLTKSWFLGGICQFLYYVLPNVSNFESINSRNIISSAAYYQPIDLVAVAWASLYGVLYCGILLGISLNIFSRRDFK